MESHLVEDHGDVRELKVKVTVRNNRLLHCRQKLGLSQTKAAKQAGVPMRVLSDYERLVRKPVDEHGNWDDCALKLCVLYAAQPDWLWPEAVQSLFGGDKVKELDVSQMLSEGPSPHLLAERKEDFKQILEFVDFLPTKMGRVIKLRYGLDGHGERTLEECGKVLGTAREWLHQIEAKALKILRKWYNQLEEEDKFLAATWPTIRVDDPEWHKKARDRRDALRRAREQIRLVEKMRSDAASEAATRAAAKLREVDKKTPSQEDLRRVFPRLEGQEVRISDEAREKLHKWREDVDVLKRRVRAMERSVETGKGYLTCLAQIMREDREKKS